LQSECANFNQQLNKAKTHGLSGGCHTLFTKVFKTLIHNTDVTYEGFKTQQHTVFIIYLLNHPKVIRKFSL